jgi:putative oxidoreductase
MSEPNHISRRTFSLSTLGVWLLQVAGAAMFLLAGGMKLAGAPEPAHAFAALGAPWMLYVTGVLEVLGGVALLVPRLAVYAALLLAGVMTGAVLTHLVVIGGSAVPALVLLLAMLGIVALRREQLPRLGATAGAPGRGTGLTLRPTAPPR